MGSVRRFSLDLALDDPRSPVAGDVLTTARNVYRITEARPVDSRVWGNRWKLTLRLVGTLANENTWPTVNAENETGARVWHSSRYAKGETPQQYFGAARPPASR